MTFRKGQSGNPGGRVGVPAEVRELARSHTKEAIERLVYWMKSGLPAATSASAPEQPVSSPAVIRRAWTSGTDARAD